MDNLRGPEDVGRISQSGNSLIRTKMIDHAAWAASQYPLLLTSTLGSLLDLEGTAVFHGLATAADELERSIPRNRVSEGL
jgi:hypothetical protein